MPNYSYPVKQTYPFENSNIVLIFEMHTHSSKDSMKHVFIINFIGVVG